MISERVDGEQIATAKGRDAAAFRQDGSEYLPLILARSVPQARDLPQFDWREQWYEFGKSLFMQLKNVLRQAAGPRDNIPGVRADTDAQKHRCVRCGLQAV